MSGHPSLLHQFLLYHHLSGYACMIAAGNPDNRSTFHTVPTWDQGDYNRGPLISVRCEDTSPSDNGIFNGIGEGVAKVEGTSHVGWGQSNNE